MTARIKQTLAYLNGFGERPRCILERGKHEIAERMIIGKREPIFEGTGERIVGIGRHSADALADITWRSDARPFAQNARRPAVIGHSDHRRGFQAHGKQRADGHRRTRSAADDHGFQAAGFRHHGIGRIATAQRPRSWTDHGGNDNPPYGFPVAYRSPYRPSTGFADALIELAVSAFGQFQIAMRDADAIALLLKVLPR